MKVGVALARVPEWDEAEDPRTTPVRIAELLSEPDPETRRLAITHGNATAAQQRIAAGDPDPRVRRQAATGDLTPGILATLSDDPYDGCQWMALRNPACPVATLRRKAAESTLALDGLIAIAANTTSPADVLATLRAHPDESIRAAASRRKKKKIP